MALHTSAIHRLFQTRSNIKNKYTDKSTGIYLHLYILSLYIYTCTYVCMSSCGYEEDLSEISALEEEDSKVSRQKKLIFR